MVARLFAFQNVQFDCGAAVFNAAFFSRRETLLEERQSPLLVGGDQVFHAGIIISLAQLTGHLFRVMGRNRSRGEEIGFGGGIGQELADFSRPVRGSRSVN